MTVNTLIYTILHADFLKHFCRDAQIFKCLSSPLQVFWKYAANIQENTYA